MDIISLYSEIIMKEMRLAKHRWLVLSADRANSATLRLAEVADSSLVKYASNNTNAKITSERVDGSIGAHNNLAVAIVEELWEFYRRNNRIIFNGYDYREITSVIRGHTARDSEKIQQLKKEMELRNSLVGRLLYCTNETATILTYLQYDSINDPLFYRASGRGLSKQKREEYAICENKVKTGFVTHVYASEKNTMEWLKTKKSVDYDETGFFTSLIIMRTLQVHERWYDWRRKDYK